MRLPWHGDAEVAIAHTFKKPPYGGSNQFLLALRTELQRRGISVSKGRIGPETRAVVLNAFLFDAETVRRRLHPGCRVVHRVDGPVAAYRGHDDGTDRTIAELNAELADVTVFQSTYSLEANRALGYELVAPVVIRNAVDNTIFRPPPAPRPPLAGRRLRLVATSWSDNPNKGFETYRRVERELDWSRFELTFVGRSPVEFERVRHVPPVPSHQLAEILREHDAFLFASRNESCSNALLEALACGLPALYHASGGNHELVGAAGLPFTRDEELPRLVERLAAEVDTLRASIAVPSIAEVADAYLAAMGLA